MPERFDASSSPSEGPSRAEMLQRMQSRDAVGQLEEALGRLREMNAQWREEESREGVPPEVVAALEEVTTAKDAPLSYQSLARRVREGRLSWLDFWLDPRREQDGQLIVRDAIAMQTKRLRSTLEEMELPPGEMAQLGRDLDAAAEKRRRDERRDGDRPGSRD